MNDEQEKTSISSYLFGWIRKGSRANEESFTPQRVEVGPEGEWKVSLTTASKAAWTTLFGLIVTAINAVATALAGISTIATEQTAIRKQGQVRALFGIAFTITGTVTTLFTAAQAYNSVVVTITNIGGAAYTFTLQHVSGSIVRKLAGPLYSLSPGDTTEITIGGMASGDFIRGDATNVAIWLSVKGAAE